MLDSARLAKARSLFPHTAQGKIYLNHAGTSPLSTRVVGSMKAYLDQRSEGKLETYQDDLPMVAECKTFVQKLVNAESPDRIALSASTSDAINIIASGIPWKSGDRILLNDLEFPANVWPFLNLKRLGVELDTIRNIGGKVTAEMMTAALTPRTRLVALSAVQFLSGYRADLGAISEMCRKRGIIFAVDGIQAVGAVRIDVQKMKIDALAAGGQKWQMSPHGTGFLYVTNELQSQIQQTNLGWLAVHNPWEFSNFTQPLAATARRYEGGSMNMPGLWGMHAALGTILEFGLDTIEDQVLGLTQVLIEEFQKMDGVELYTSAQPGERAGIVTIKQLRTDEKLVFKKLMDRNITPALRDGKLRFSPHFYCSAEEMRTVAGAVKECL